MFSFSQVSPRKTYMHISSSSHVLHALPILVFLTVKAILIELVGISQLIIEFVSLLLFRLCACTRIRAGESSMPITYNLRTRSKKVTRSKWHLADECFVVAMTCVITVYWTPDADNCCGRQSPVVNVFLISPSSADISNCSLVEMSFNLAKSEKAKGQWCKLL